MISPNSFDSTLVYNALVEELDEENVKKKNKKRLSSNTCSASLFYKGRDSACFCFRGDVHGDGAEGGWDVSMWSFSTCSREQHSQNSFLLLSFSTMLGDVQLILHWCPSSSSSLIQNTHTVYTDCTTTRHWHSGETCVWSAQKADLYCFHRAGKQSWWDLSLSSVSNLLHLSIVVAKCRACRVIHQTGSQFLHFCRMLIRNTALHVRALWSLISKSSWRERVQCQTAVPSRG